MGPGLMGQGGAGQTESRAAPEVRICRVLAVPPPQAGAVRKGSAQGVPGAGRKKSRQAGEAAAGRALSEPLDRNSSPMQQGGGVPTAYPGRTTQGCSPFTCPACHLPVSEPPGRPPSFMGDPPSLGMPCPLGSAAMPFPGHMAMVGRHGGSWVHRGWEWGQRRGG